MALIKCPDCEKEISTRVKACPNCGCPIDIVLSEGTIIKNNIKEEDTEELEATEDSSDEEKHIEEENQIKDTQEEILCDNDEVETNELNVEDMSNDTGKNTTSEETEETHVYETYGTVYTSHNKAKKEESVNSCYETKNYDFLGASIFRGISASYKVSMTDKELSVKKEIFSKSKSKPKITKIKDITEIRYGTNFDLVITLCYLVALLAFVIQEFSQDRMITYIIFIIFGCLAFSFLFTHEKIEILSKKGKKIGFEIAFKKEALSFLNDVKKNPSFIGEINKKNYIFYIVSLGLQLLLTLLLVVKIVIAMCFTGASGTIDLYNYINYTEEQFVNELHLEYDNQFHDYLETELDIPTIVFDNNQVSTIDIMTNGYCFSGIEVGMSSDKVNSVLPDIYKLDDSQSLEDVKTYIADGVGAILIGYGPDDTVKSILWYNQATIDGLEATINEDESEIIKDSSIQDDTLNNDNISDSLINEEEKTVSIDDFAGSWGIPFDGSQIYDFNLDYARAYVEIRDDTHATVYFEFGIPYYEARISMSGIYDGDRTISCLGNYTEKYGDYSSGDTSYMDIYEISDSLSCSISMLDNGDIEINSSSGVGDGALNVVYEKTMLKNDYRFGWIDLCDRKGRYSYTDEYGIDHQFVIESENNLFFTYYLIEVENGRLNNGSAIGGYINGSANSYYGSISNVMDMGGINVSFMEENSDVVYVSDNYGNAAYYYRIYN